ncbi:MAG: tRNA lysidine(34) synthetase TilS [Burkholderiales bacterium]
MNDPLSEVVGKVLKEVGLHGGTIALGLSGGMDSVVLLDVLDRLRATGDFRLRAVHVNHQISVHSGAWEEFCGSLCRDRQVDFEAHRVRVIAAGEGIEAAARRLRYEVLEGIACDAIALAHHADDQVETFLLQLLRGAGPKGLAAMPVARPLREASIAGKAQWLLRPLLDVSRAQIRSYAALRQLSWVEDDSNSDARYDRNFVRIEILPRLETRFPAYRETLTRSARNLADYARVAEAMAFVDAGEAKNGAIPVDRLRSLPDARALNLLRHLFDSQHLSMPPRVRLEEALRQCREAARDASVRVEFDDHVLRCHRGLVELLAQNAEMPVDWHSAWDGQQLLALPGGLGRLSARTAIGDGIALRHFKAQAATVRGRTGGERMQSAHNRPSRTLKNLFQEHAIPPWERQQMPLVFFGERLAWVPGIGVAIEFRAAGGEVGVTPEWQEVEEQP